MDMIHDFILRATELFSCNGHPIARRVVRWNLVVLFFSPVFTLGCDRSTGPTKNENDAEKKGDAVEPKSDSRNLVTSNASTKKQTDQEPVTVPNQGSKGLRPSAASLTVNFDKRDLLNRLIFRPVYMDFGVPTDLEASRAALVRGRTSAKDGDFRKAYSDFQLAVMHNSSDAIARGELGFAGQHLSMDNAELLRTAETLADSDSVRSAIVHNLATAYEEQGLRELAQRARNRARALKGAHDLTEHDSCSVVVRVSQEPVIQVESWLDVYGAVVQDQNALWGEPPKTDEGARELLCESVDSRSPSFAPDPTPKPCASSHIWALTTGYEYPGLAVATTHHLWPLRDGRVGHVAVARAQTMANSCMGGDEEALRFGSFAIYRTVREELFQPWNIDEIPQGFETCGARIAISHHMHLLDLTLGRQFEFLGLNSDVRLFLHPKEHAVSVKGRFCDVRIPLEDCETGVCGGQILRSAEVLE